MTLAEFGALLQTSTLPVAYEAFPEDNCPDMPFVTYQMVGTNNVAADGRVYKKVPRIQVDLFTEYKDEASEEKLEATFSEFFWNSVQSDDPQERCHIETYIVEII